MDTAYAGRTPKLGQTAILHLLERVDGQWQAAGGEPCWDDQHSSAEDDAHRKGEAWAGEDPNRRYEVTLKRF